jgi:O-antigen ligase/cytochrome c-type biogenesis protein CcmH/NrfG
MTLNKVLRAIVYGGVFALPFVPLIVSQTMFFPFITAKNIAFRVIIEIIFASWLVLAMRDPLYRPKRSVLGTTVLVFLVVIFIADVFGASFANSFWSNFERMEGWVTLVHLVAYFFTVSSVLSGEALWKRFFHTSIGVSVLMGFYGIFQLLGWITINQGGVRLDGRLGNATYLAIYMLFHIFLTALYLARHRGERIWRWVYGTIIVLQLAILYFTASRGVALGLVIGLFVTALLITLFERSPERRMLRRSALGALILIGGLVIGFFALRSIPAIKENPVLGRYVSISLSEGSTRFQVWNMAWQGFKERPILGWGQSNFDVVFNKYYDPQMYAQEPWFDRAHNVVFDWLIAGGILGFLAYLSLYATGLVLLWKNKIGAFSTIDKAILTGLFTAYFFQLLFVFDNITSYFLFFSVLAFLHALGGTPTRSRMVEAIAPVLIVLALGSLYIVNLKPYLASRTLIQALVRQPGGPSENLAYFRQTIGYNSFGSAEAREQLIQSAISVAAAPETVVSAELKNEFLGYAADEMRKQTVAAPRSARYWFFYGSYLRRIGRLDEAVAAIERAHELSPKKQQISYELALAYTSAGRTEEGLTLMREAFDSAPGNREARVLYAALAIRARQFDLADELLIGEAGSGALTDERVFRAYIEAGQMDKIVLIAERRLADNPGDAQAYVSLAAAYLQAGNKAKSIETLERMATTLPDTRAQADKFIADIRAGKTQ